MLRLITSRYVPRIHRFLPGTGKWRFQTSYGCLVHLRIFRHAFNRIHTVGIHDDVFCKKRCSLFENPVMIACWVALCPGKLLKDYATEVRCWVVRTIAYQHGKLFPGHCQFFRRSNEGRGTLVVHLEPTLTLPEILRIVVQRGFETRPFLLQFEITFGWECDVLIMKKGKKRHEISLWLTRNESWWWRF